MTDEEKRVIIPLQSNRDKLKENFSYTKLSKKWLSEDIDKAINLIKKQSKEIEELNKSDLSKEQSSMNYYNLYKELVNKIKAKIEEWDIKDLTIYYGGRTQGRTFQQAVRTEVEKILHSLLEEKEE